MEKDYRQAFVLNLDTVRKKKNITQEELASKAMITRDAIASYFRERNPKTPNLVTAAMISKALDTSLDYLCGLTSIQTLNFDTSPEIYLQNIYNFVKYSGFKLDIDTNSVTLTCNNPYVINFLNTAIKINLETNVEKLTSSYNNDYIIRNGQLVSIKDDANSQLEQKKLCYIYGDIDDEILKEVPDEVHIDIENRIKEWKITNGNPQKYISEIYAKKYLRDNDKGDENNA